MNSIDVRQEVHRVIGDANGTPAMRFPHDPRAADLVVDTTRMFLRYAGAPTETQRAQFIRKFAAYVIRRGWKGNHISAHLFGALWFATHPEHLSTRLGFAAAINAQCEEFLRQQNSERLLTEDDIIDDLDETPVVAKPILLVRGDFVLEQLVHAAHLVEVGLALNNCLKTKVGRRFLPHAAYWTRIKRGERHLFSVRHRACICFLVEVGEGRVTQYQFHKAPKELYWVYKALTDRIQHELGPIAPGDFGYAWPMFDPRLLGLSTGEGA